LPFPTQSILRMVSSMLLWYIQCCMQQEAGYSNCTQNWVGDWMGDRQEFNVKKNSHVTDAVWDQNVCMYVYMYVCMHVYVRVNVCVCMCVWERERERERAYVWVCDIYSMFTTPKTSYVQWKEPCTHPELQRPSIQLAPLVVRSSTD